MLGRIDYKQELLVLDVPRALYSLLPMGAGRSDRLFSAIWPYVMVPVT
jgi:hypothetical protein